MTLVVQRSDVERFRAIVARRLGLSFEDAKLEQLADLLGRLHANIKRSGTLEEYLDQLAAGHRDALRSLAENLTVGETYFFRYRDHFRALVEAVLPERMEARDSPRELRILSAGTASGEEAYTLAILAHEQLRAAAARRVEIVG